MFLILRFYLFPTPGGDETKPLALSGSRLKKIKKHCYGMPVRNLQTPV